VPQKQPKRSRLWLNDGHASVSGPSGPTRCGPTTSSKTALRTAGVRMLTVIDEFTRRCLAIVVARKLNSDDVLDCLTHLFVRTGRRRTFAPTRRPQCARLARPDWREDALHRARQPLGERLLREAARRTPGAGAPKRRRHTKVWTQPTIWFPSPPFVQYSRTRGLIKLWQFSRGHPGPSRGPAGGDSPLRGASVALPRSSLTCGSSGSRCNDPIRSSCSHC
jgi:hypothetical protein